ncbi:MAG TPA: exodeoxyribonuclease VII large subunit, partial [Ktedonobacterales bacterium]
MRVVTVSDFSSYLKSLLAEDYALQDIWVQGEVGNYSSSGPGHRYFTIREGNAELHCVMWATHARGAPPLRQGMAVMAHGSVSYYESRGALQLYVDEVREAGIGQLYMEFERLKARLYAEGLFAPERKRPIPDLPRTVGVVTSLRAAALQDILRTLGMRNPLARVIIAPASVQGMTAAHEIATALDLLNEHGEADVILLARGGGSLEELWAFNEAEVAYAIARSVIPVVSGVGHETDTTIADFVADWRASTPTAAAMSVSPDSGVLAAELTERAVRLDDLMAARLDDLMLRADRLTQALGSARLSSRVRELSRQLAQSETLLDLSMRHRLLNT